MFNEAKLGSIKLQKNSNNNNNTYSNNNTEIKIIRFLEHISVRGIRTLIARLRGGRVRHHPLNLFSKYFCRQAV